MKKALCITVLAALLTTSGVSQTSAPNAEDLYREWKALSDDLERAATDALADRSKSREYQSKVFSSTIRSGQIVDELRKIFKDNGDLNAAFRLALIKWDEADFITHGIDRQPADIKLRLHRSSESMYKESLTLFRQCAASGNASAAWNIGVMISKGSGVAPSNLLAANWFAKSGALFLKAGDIESAWRALEKAESVDRNLRYAIDLRRAIEANRYLEELDLFNPTLATF